ncbi:RluA family pseudouridine synthase [Holzapfeliella sp. He02]|uniref:RNA pseudouridylate synthase n=1 Tax=Holzapfeliella saturejae TaxID=3082953 RepID=A0ABU8SH02_9LACO
MSLPNERTLTLPQNFTPCTIRELLTQLYIPKKWQHFLRIEKAVTINGSYKPINTTVFAGDTINLTFTQVDSTQTYLPSRNLPDIVYEDTDIIIINKPAGQKTHPNRPDENNTAMNDVEYYLNRTNEHVYMIHRLDMWTSGLLLLAKNPVVVPILNRQLALKIMKRFYLAIVRKSKPILANGTISDPIGLDETDKRKRQVRKNGLLSVTHFSVVNQTQDLATLKLDLETGRTHQIRVHLSHHEMPIINDPLYDPLADSSQIMSLKAYEIQLIKPFSFAGLTVNLNP